jgi:hypothetical protein
LEPPNLLALDQPQLLAKLMESSYVGADIDEYDGHEDHDDDDGGGVFSPTAQRRAWS